MTFLCLYFLGVVSNFGGLLRLKVGFVGQNINYKMSKKLLNNSGLFHCRI